MILPQGRAPKSLGVLGGIQIMATTNNTVMNAMSFFAFCRTNGKMKRANIPLKDGSGSFDILKFHDTGVELHFSKKLGRLSPAELKERRDALQCIQDSESPNIWHLCTYGANETDENCWD